MRRRRFNITAVSGLVSLVSGCSYYSFSGSLPGHIKTAAVPLFDNQTIEPGIVEEVTKTVVDAIISNGSMKVVGEFQADAVVRGTIIDVVDEADSYSGNERASEFKFSVLAEVEFFDRVKNRTIWKEPRLEGWARYDATGSGDVSREEGKQKALEMLAKEIIDRTVAGW